MAELPPIPRRPTPIEPAPAPPPTAWPPAAAPPVAPSPPVGYGQAGAYIPATPSSAATGRRRHIADIVVSSILLFFGLLGAAGAGVTAAILPSAMQQQYDDYSLGTFEPTADFTVIQHSLWIACLVLFLTALGLTVMLIAKKRPSFYIPLIAGVVSTLLYWILVVAALVADPALNDAINP